MKNKFNRKSGKRYYIPGIDNIHQLVETPASKERTDSRRFFINTTISVIAAVASIIAAIVTVLAYIKV